MWVSVQLCHWCCVTWQWYSALPVLEWNETVSLKSGDPQKCHLCLLPALLLLGLRSESHQRQSPGSRPLLPLPSSGAGLTSLWNDRSLNENTGLTHFPNHPGPLHRWEVINILPQVSRSRNYNKLLACGGGGDSRMLLYVPGSAPCTGCQ